ncbi:unnamed protein product [Zymoseptoria tritici ST99CH_1E4]|uniref:Uncharacterized protein n=2 Tax=Zymoseptoria tritici TaxID=1047171 RepID=F9X2I5_ZYMTI|nr:uncharacterized protein MYCGRDRAFT_37539 [Zymoseptoria tritici IPO323]EGP89697.1 hypothetical protein MYCGRDRAFT_37539 [Zymoseptoria tritici IPO323]SMR45659.1 unnamed protein product [Zymoseptoria tritici ST99CH_1E4]
MSHNFAPYQASPPESVRAKSPPPARTSIDSSRPQAASHTRNISAVSNASDPWAAARAQRLPSPSQYADEDEGYTDLEGGGARPYNNRYNDYIGSTALQGAGQTSTSIFETSLGIPIHVEACLAYLILPPAGGVVLLLFEHKSDYVRFHAWQSALLFSTMFFIHIIFSWTKVVSWMLFVVDMAAIVYLAAGAWRNADTLDRVEVPFLGRLASSFVDEE